MGLFIFGTTVGGRLATSLDVMGLVLQAGPIVKLVLLLLAIMSIISWAIIVYKWRELARAQQDSEAFLEVYHREGFSAAFEAARKLQRGPLALLFLGAHAEMKRHAARGEPARADTSLLAALEGDRGRAVLKGLNWTAARETARLERGLSFLATTGSSAPFIGLFGTVIGIIQAFQGIALSGNASLSVVAPGIAEALIATAVGLLAAIPASIFYNNFVARVEVIANSIELFRAEFEIDLGRLTKRGPRRSAPRAVES